MLMNWAKAGSDECEAEKSESHSWTDCGNQHCHLFLFLGSGHPVYYQNWNNEYLARDRLHFKKYRKNGFH